MTQITKSAILNTWNVKHYPTRIRTHQVNPNQEVIKMLDKKQLIDTLTCKKVVKNKILDLLLDNKLTQSEVARDIGVTRQYVSKIYNENKLHIDLWRAAHATIKTE